MSALGSSVINKSTKKFVPKKAPVRRAPDANSRQVSADSHADQLSGPRAQNALPTQSAAIEAPVSLASASTQAPKEQTPLPTRLEQATRNTSLPISTSSRASSISRAPVRQSPQQSSSLIGVIVPPSQASSLEVVPNTDPAQFDALDGSALSAQAIHADAPPNKRRRVATRGNQTQTSLAPDLPVAPANTEEFRVIGESQNKDQANSTKTKNLGASRNGKYRQNSTNDLRSTTKTAPIKTRKPRKGKGKVASQSGPQDDQDEDDDVDGAQQGAGQSQGTVTKYNTRKSRHTHSKKALEDAAAAIVESAVHGSSKRRPKKGKRHRRGATPEEAEHVQIDVGETKMADLCRDGGTGQKSFASKVIQENELAAKQKKAQQEARSVMGQTDDSTAQALEDRESRLDRLDREWRQREEAMANVVPQQHIVNGEIVLDTSSLRIDRHAMAAVERDAEQFESVEEDEYTRKVNSSLGLKRDKSGGWSEDLVDRFYDGLRMFGTDFGMISKLFPGKTRHSIKLKFCKEERWDSPRIRAALLGEALPVELEELQKMTGEEYDDPAVLERDIEEDKRQLEADQEKEKEAIEAARIERAEQAEADRLMASQDEEGSAKESRKRKRKKGEQDGKRKEKGEKTQKGPTRTKRKKSHKNAYAPEVTGEENMEQDA